jgi:hypothetical protein
VAVFGDYSFQFLIKELAIGAQYNVPFVVILLNNYYLGLIRQTERAYEMNFEVQLGFDNVNSPKVGGYGSITSSRSRPSTAWAPGCSSRATSRRRSAGPQGARRAPAAGIRRGDLRRDGWSDLGPFGPGRGARYAGRAPERPT